MNSGYQGPKGKEEKQLLANAYGRCDWNDEKVLKWYRGDCECTLRHWLLHFDMAKMQILHDVYFTTTLKMKERKTSFINIT